MILRERGELAACWQARVPAAVGNEVDKRSLYEELQDIPEHRRGQGRKHSLATVLAVYLLAMLSNMRGPVAAAEYAQALDQEELKLLGAWYNRATGRYEPPTKSTIHRVVMATDSEALEELQQRYATARVAAPEEPGQRQALAADGKRIRGANRNGTMRYETATLVEHRTGVPVASLNFHDQNGELAAVGALLEVVPISGAVITLDALHTTRDTTVSIVEQHDADYLLTVKRNCSETFEALASMPWEDAAGRFSEDPQKGHGRIDRRHIEVLTPLAKTLNFNVAQVFRVRRERTDLKSGEYSVEYAYGITSLPPPARRHRNCWPGIAATGRSSRRTIIAATRRCAKTPVWRAAVSPANRATCNNIVLALILHHRRWDNAAQALRYFTLRRSEAFKALLAPARRSAHHYPKSRQRPRCSRILAPAL